MTAPDVATAAALERVLALLPVHVRARDEASRHQLLRTLLHAVASELSVLEADIDELYSSWFVETCPEWVVPYLADLVGVTDLPPDLSAGQGHAAGSGAAVGRRAVASRRAVVANTVAYRRGKGTVAVIERVARDVTGWPARAVEYFRLLAATTHVNHVRLDRPATASIRDAGALDFVLPRRRRRDDDEMPRLDPLDPLDPLPPAFALGALNPLAHTAEVRRIETGRGRYGIPNVGVFLFSTQVYDTGWVSARSTTDGWTVHPLGDPTPLFAVPTTVEAVERLVRESDLPVPLRPRRLFGLLRDARETEASALPIAVRVEDERELSAERIRVCGMDDLATETDGSPLEGWQVMVDAVSGRLHSYDNGVSATPASMQVRCAYGNTADVGAGSYERSDVHEAALVADPYTGDSARGGTATRGQRRVSGGDDPAVNHLAATLAQAETDWAAVDSPAGATYVIAIDDSAMYQGALSVHIPEATRLILVAASWRERQLGNGEVLPTPRGVYAPEGLRPLVVGNVTVTGQRGSSFVLDGVVVDGDLVVAPGRLGSLTVSQSTLSGSVQVQASGDESEPESQTNQDLTVHLVRAIVGGTDLAGTVPSLVVRDCILTGDVIAPGAHVAVEGSTVRAEMAVRTLDASSSILDGVVVAAHRQTGCVRFSYVEPGSRVPRRFHCVPAADSATALRPVYVSDEPGSPSYLSLAASCPVAIAQGGEYGAEMGVHHHLRRPLRMAAAQRLLAPYVPVGLEIGMVGS